MVVRLTRFGNTDVLLKKNKRGGSSRRFFCILDSLCQKRKNGRDGDLRRPSHILHEHDCKPGSVFDSHLSTRRVAAVLQPPRERSGQPICSHTGVAPDRVYSIGHSRADGCALTAPFHPYLRYLHTSGGLFLLHFSSDRSGRALPVILALWSPDFPHSGPFGLAARLSVILAQLF